MFYEFLIFIFWLHSERDYNIYTWTKLAPQTTQEKQFGMLNDFWQQWVRMFFKSSFLVFMV